MSSFDYCHLSFFYIAILLINLNFSIKLDNKNYLVKKEQFLPIIISYGLDDAIKTKMSPPIHFLDGSSKNNPYCAPWN